MDSLLRDSGIGGIARFRGGRGRCVWKPYWETWGEGVGVTETHLILKKFEQLQNNFMLWQNFESPKLKLEKVKKSQCPDQNFKIWFIKCQIKSISERSISLNFDGRKHIHSLFPPPPSPHSPKRTTDCFCFGCSPAAVPSSGAGSPSLLFDTVSDIGRPCGKCRISCSLLLFSSIGCAVAVAVHSRLAPPPLCTAPPEVSGCARVEGITMSVEWVRG